MATGKTVTATCAPVCSEEHDLDKEKREKLDYIDHDRTDDNITFEYRPLQEVYQEQFGAAIEQYNEKQKRPERRKSVEGYMNELENNVTRYKKMNAREKSDDNSVKSRYEMLLYVGDMHDTGYKSDPAAAKQAEEILTEYVQGFKERNPNMVVQYSYMHRDEATPHAGIVFVPVASGYKTGLDKRVSMSKALAQQGFPDKRGEIGFDKWIKSERAELRRLAEERGLSIVEKNDPKRERLTAAEYKSQSRAIERETERQLKGEMEKSPLRRLKQEKPNMLGYVSGETYERLYKEYCAIGDRCFKAEKLVKETAALDKQKLDSDNAQLVKDLDVVLAAHDEKEKALAKSQGETKQAVAAFKTAVGALSKDGARYLSNVLQKGGYNQNLTEIAGNRVKEWERIERRQQSQQTETLDLSSTRKSSGKTRQR
ncbi:MAG: plasmid recombination protein [Acidaminococcaceae bacterium]|nr:plasmid recombination protein [Paludibacteraceae bacterium]MBQ9283712.1 plasmid recombination protein [Acidaminococcaceae bacterium]